MMTAVLRKSTTATVAAIAIFTMTAGAADAGILAGAADPVLDSMATGALVGAAGGPIGIAVGAGLGLLHGLWSKRRHEAQARAEDARQRALNRDLERELAQQPRGPRGDADEEGQGVLILADNLAGEAPGASPRPAERGTRVASVPPASDAPPSARPATPPASDPASAGLDAEGFRPIHEGGRLVRREHRGPDGKVDVVLHYDTRGRIVRREESSRLDGRLDTSAYYADGLLQRKESDTDGDEKPDLWAFYDDGGELTRLESVAADGRRRVERYRAGRVTERLDGDLLSVFDDTGRLVKEGRRGEGERMLAWRHYEPGGNVAREEEFDADGGLSAVAHYEAGRIVRRELYQIDEQAFTRVPLVATDGTSTPDGRGVR
jgi:hypothetical protein